MSLVIDASLALAWLFEEEQTEAVRDLIRGVAREGAIVPPIWRFEIANVLQLAVRRGRIAPEFRDTAISSLAVLDIAIDGDSLDYVWSATLGLAAQHGLTVYDASYLELAERLRLPLATLDKALAQAARNAAVEVLP